MYNNEMFFIIFPVDSDPYRCDDYLREIGTA